MVGARFNQTGILSILLITFETRIKLIEKNKKFVIIILYEKSCINKVIWIKMDIVIGINDTFKNRHNCS